jgi:molybdopterin-guanine dinucleotide biosynthesis protein A
VTVPPLVAVLAGGAGRRMGAPKATAVLDGRPLVAFPLAAAAAAGLEAVVVAKADTALPELPVPIWEEPAEPRHPLAGIVAALERGGRDVIAVGCDQPFVTGALLAALAAAEGAVAVTAGDALAPLPARWPHAALDGLRADLDARAPLRRALAQLHPAVLDVPGAAGLVAGVNTPAELAAAGRTLASPP